MKPVLNPPVKYFLAVPLWVFYIFCLLFVMRLCASVYLYVVVTCLERSDLLALICGVLLCVCHFPLVSGGGCGT